MFIDKISNEYLQVWKLKMALECQLEETTKELMALKDELKANKEAMVKPSDSDVVIPKSFEPVEEKH